MPDPVTIYGAARAWSAMTEPGPVPAEPAIVWWPWAVLAIGPALAAVSAALDDDPAGSVVAFVIVAALALLFLAILFTPALLLISRNAEAPVSVRRRAGLVFIACVAGAHLSGRIIDRSGPDDGGGLWALAFIGTYVAASAIAWAVMRRMYTSTPPERD